MRYMGVLAAAALALCAGAATAEPRYRCSEFQSAILEVQQAETFQDIINAMTRAGFKPPSLERHEYFFSSVDSAKVTALATLQHVQQHECMNR